MLKGSIKKSFSTTAGAFTDIRKQRLCCSVLDVVCGAESVSNYIVGDFPSWQCVEIVVEELAKPRGRYLAKE
jgi:hypothetical protein